MGMKTPRRKPSPKSIKSLENSRWTMLDNYKTSKTRARFQCQLCGQIINSNFNRMSSRPLLCDCRRERNEKKRTQTKIRRVQEIAKSRGGEFLSNSKVIETKKRYSWRCSKGHEWQSSVLSVVYRNSWCPVCAGNAPRKLEELSTVVELRGGKLLDNQYRGVDANYRMICSKGHEFRNQFKKIVNNGQWCGICSRGSKSEELARTTFEQIFGANFPKARPNWLRNSRGNQMELDGYCEDLGLAFEYQGRQHFERVTHFVGDLAERVADDKTKKKLCEQNGVLLFYLHHTTKPEAFGAAIRKQATKFKIKESYDYSKKIDLNKAYIRDDRLENLRSILEAKQIDLLSAKWIDTNTKYRLSCKNCGYEWFAKGNAFFSKRPAPGCRKCARIDLANKQRGSIYDLEKYAQEFGGRVVSKTYTTAQSKYRFICKNGHSFENKFNNMKSRKQFCPFCENRQTREFASKSVFTKRLEMKGLEAREKVISFTQPVLVRCKRCAEEFRISLKSLKQASTKGCPFCSGYKVREADARRLMSKLGYEPVTSFPGGSKPWKVKCIKCGSIRNKSISSLKKNQKKCGHKGTEYHSLRKN
jgi:hypothetical protein